MRFVLVFALAAFAAQPVLADKKQEVCNGFANLTDQAVTHSCKVCGENLKSDLYVWPHASEHCNRNLQECIFCDGVLSVQRKYEQHSKPA